jgi:hypothetical protein
MKKFSGKDKKIYEIEETLTGRICVFGPHRLPVNISLPVILCGIYHMFIDIFFSKWQYCTCKMCIGLKGNKVFFDRDNY